MSYASSAEPIKLGYLFDFLLPDGYPARLLGVRRDADHLFLRYLIGS